jgi:iron complex transport system substrate-binding protein
MARTSASPRTRSRARGRRIWFLALTLLLWVEPALAAVSVVDDDGQTVTLQQPAGRVIALYGALSEIVVGMGREGALVARTNADQSTPAVGRLPAIGTHMRPNIESVLAQKPDLVLQMAGRKEAALPVEALRRQGVRVAVFRAASFSELMSVIRRVGVLLGARAEAEAMAKALEARLAALDVRAAKAASRPRVFFEVRSPNMLAAGDDGLVAEIIRHAGGANCVAEAARFAHLGEEEIVRLAPEAYVIQRGPMNPAPLPLSQRPRLAAIPAAKSGRAWFVDERKYSRPGPQSVDAAEELFGLLHPELNAPTPKGKK